MGVRNLPKVLTRQRPGRESNLISLSICAVRSCSKSADVPSRQISRLSTLTDVATATSPLTTTRRRRRHGNQRRRRHGDQSYSLPRLNLPLLQTLHQPTGLSCQTTVHTHNDDVSVIHLLFYCDTLPMSYMADQRKILFCKKALICDNVIVRTLANISKYTISLILSKYCIKSINTNVNDIKLQMWKHFVDDCAEHGRVTFY